MGALSDIGLGMQGASAAEKDRQDVELGSQRVKAGQMGLEDLQRTRDTSAAVRDAAIAGSNAGQDMGGTFEDMALAAEKKGDTQQALQLRQARKALEDEGIKNVVHKALLDPTPGKRPDLAEEFNRYGKRRDMPGDVELDEKGNLWATDPKTGKRGSINVGVTAERLGLVKPWEKDLKPGDKYLRGNSTTGKVDTYTNEPKSKFTLHDGILFNEGTGAYQQVNTSGKWTLGKITHGSNEVPVAVNSSTGEVNLLGPGGVRTGLDAHVSQPTTPGGPTVVTMPGGGVSVFTPSTEGKPAQSHVFSQNEPAVPPQPAQLNPVASPEAPPLQGARRGTAPGTTDKWFVPDPNNQGKYLQVVLGGSPDAAPAAAPAAKPAPAAAPRRPAPAAAPAAAAPADEKIPDVEAASAGQSPAARHQSRVAGARAEQEKAKSEAPKKRAVETFRSIASSPRMTAEDAPLIQEAIDTGMLTPAEKSKAERMLSKLQPQRAGYSDGGVIQKVSRGIEMVGRVAGTERGKSLERAEKSVAPDKSATILDRGKSVDEKVEAAERGYARGGKVSRHGL